MFSDLLESIMLKSKYREDLLAYAKKNPPACETNKKECQRCGTCCYARPGDITQDDLNRAAKLLSMSPQEFFDEYCCVDAACTSDAEEGKFLVIFRREHQEGGVYVDWRETYNISTPCVFFKNNACRIQDAKPTVCARQGCWNMDKKRDAFEGAYYWSKDELKALGYDGYFEGCEDYE